MGILNSKGVFFESGTVSKVRIRQCLIKSIKHLIRDYIHPDFNRLFQLNFSIKKKTLCFRLTAVRKTGLVPTKVTPSPRSSFTTTPDPVTSEWNVNPRFWMDERSVNTLSQKLTVPLQLQLDSVSDGLKEEYRSLLGSLRDDLYSLKMETAGFHGTLDQKLVNALRTLCNEV